MINLCKSVKEYLTMRRRLGFELKNAEIILNKFTVYMNQHKKTHITSKLALEFAIKNKRTSLAWQSQTLGVIRRFAQHHQIFDSKTEIPATHILSYSYRRRLPYIFSDREIKELLKSCQHLITKDSIHAWTYYVFFGLIAVTGIRTEEAISLSRQSVDTNQGILTILESKNKKSRKIPIDMSVAKILKHYLEVRDCFLKKSSQYFFVDDYGMKLHPAKAIRVFRELCNLARIFTKSKPPRIIELRHTFAVKTLENFYKKKGKVREVIPMLAMYLGHENPKHTYWYLTMTPKLMKLVVNGLEEKFGGKR